MEGAAVRPTAATAAGEEALAGEITPATPVVAAAVEAAEVAVQTADADEMEAAGKSGPPPKLQNSCGGNSLFVVVNE